MRPPSLPLIVPKSTPAVVVDPLHDFMDEKGVFTQCYGREETEPMRNLLPTLNQMVRVWRGKAHVVLCQSLYSHNQWGVKGLENLCTQENLLGREPCIDERFFQSAVTKSRNSITSIPTEEWRELARNTKKHLILTGVTTTSCIAKTVEALRSGFWKIIIPADAVASRASQQKKEEALLDSWSDEHLSRVIVVPHWRDITFSPLHGGASLYS